MYLAGEWKMLALREIKFRINLYWAAAFRPIKPAIAQFQLKKRAQSQQERLQSLNAPSLAFTPQELSSGQETQSMQRS